MCSRHNVNAQYDALYILGFRFLVKKQRSANLAVSRYAYTGDLPIHRTRIVFRSEENNYGGNPKYIAEEIMRRKLPWELIWIVDKNFLRYMNDFPSAIRLDMIGSLEAIEDSATAHIWIDNTWRTDLLDNGVVKKEGQLYLQTWRGSYGIKKFGLGRNSFNPDTWKRVWADVRQMDYFISHSIWENNFYRRTFRAENILQFGHPCNDIFFRKDQDTIRYKVFEKLGIPTDKRLVLYAPTRNNNRARSVFNMDYHAVLTALGEKFGGEWVMAARMTPYANREHFIPNNLGIINVSNYADIHEILAATDACISDYSSCIFDYLHTKKPAFIYASDRASFERGRGLYYPLTQTPFPVAEGNEQLLKNIRNFNVEHYMNKTEEFLREKGSIEDGHAAERVVDFMERVI